MTPQQIVAAARACVGTPFRHQGRTPGRGLDCAGLLIVVAREVGIDPVDVSGYPRRPDGNLKAALDMQPGLERVTGTPQAGDFILFHYEDDAHEGHLGICTGANLIHAWAHARKVAEHAFTPEWQRRVAAVYRIKGIENGE